MYVPKSLCEPKNNKLIENVVKNTSKLHNLAGEKYFKLKVNLSKLFNFLYPKCMKH